jgi:hypothetical protein
MASLPSRLQILPAASILHTKLDTKMPYNGTFKIYEPQSPRWKKQYFAYLLI